MPITASDAISGTIYVVTASAEDAQRRALDYLSSGEAHAVFDHEKDAVEYLRDPFRPRSSEECVYAVSLDIRATEK